MFSNKKDPPTENSRQQMLELSNKFKSTNLMYVLFSFEPCIASLFSWIYLFIEGLSLVFSREGENQQYL